MRSKRPINIFNFVTLKDEHFNKVRDYRNQEFVRGASIYQDRVSYSEHQEYRSRLLRQDREFAYIVQNESTDYGVISIHRIDSTTCSVGDYLVDEKFKFEGGGIVNRLSICKICNHLGFTRIKAKQQAGNTRGSRAGGVFTVAHLGTNNGFDEFLSEVPDYEDSRVRNSRARKMFDKLYFFDRCIF